MTSLSERFEQAFPIANMRESRLNPRKTFDDGKLGDLADSILQVGITTPLIGRPHPEEQGAVETAAGHRRLRAAKKAGLEFVPVVIRDYTDEQFFEVITIENLQREDIHPMEEAEGYAAWLKMEGHTVLMLAAKLAKVESYIYQRLRLLELIDPLRDDFRGDRFSIAHAVKLARLGAAQQKELREHYLYDRDGGPVSMRALQVIIETKVYLDLARAVFPIQDEKLLPGAGSCERCEKRTGANRGLFDEIKEGDYCLDRACFYKKSNAHAALKLKQIEKKNAADGKPAAVQISAHWGTDKKGVLSTDQYKIVRRGKECESTLDAVCVEEHRHGQGEVRLGEAVKICSNKKCRQHWGGLYGGPTTRAERTAGEILSDLRVREKEEKAEAVRVALIAAAVEIAQETQFDLTIMRELALVMWSRLWNDSRVKVLARRGLKQKTTRDGSREDTLRDNIREMQMPELQGLIAEIAIMETGHREPNEHTMQSLLLAEKTTEFIQGLKDVAVEEIAARYKQRRQKVEAAEEKRLAAEKAAKAAAKNQPAAEASAAKKGKAKK